MELHESEAKILEILFDMFRNHAPEKIVSTCKAKQWKLEDCIESLLENDLASGQGAVPKAGTRNIEPLGLENPAEESRILNQIQSGRRVMVIMRGAPGSGKSYLARTLVANSMPGLKYYEMRNFIFSTDDYFTTRRGIYNFQARKLTDAHSDNQRKVEAKAMAGCSPIVVDNTNMQVWEMKPYVEIALRNGYTVELLEPQTPWKHSAELLATKNGHGVPFEKIKSMLERYEAATAEQLVQMVKNGTVPQQNLANPPIRDANSPQKKLTNLETPNSERQASKISLGLAPLPQRQSFQSKSMQNVSMQSSLQRGLNTVFNVQPEPFRDITGRAEANKNIPECYDNMPYQNNNQVSTHSTLELKNTAAIDPLSSYPPIKITKNIIETKTAEFVELQLNNSIIYQLDSLIGTAENNDLNLFEETNEFLTIFVPRSLAESLYTICCQARQEKFEKQKRETDEDFAKLVQNTKYSEISEAPENLQELLDYEMALRLLNSEPDEPPQSSQENLATYLKKLQVAENFAETPNQPEKPLDEKLPKNANIDKENRCLALNKFEENRNLAVHHCQLKGECYQKAKEMAQKGNNAVAGYYSQIAHFHKKKIDMYNERAANCIVEVHMLTSDNQDLLDLHHLHVAEAIECLDLFLDRHISNTRGGTRAYKNVFIITGRGLHSTGGISIIKNKVRARLKERNLKWNEVNPGLLKVKVFSSSRFSK